MDVCYCQMEEIVNIVKSIKLGMLLLAAGSSLPTYCGGSCSKGCVLEEGLIRPSQEELNKNLHKEIGRGDLPAIRQLLEQGADVNAQDGDGSNALMKAIYFCRVDVVQLFLSGGADVDIQDTCGNIPIRIAIVNNRADLVLLLIEHGIDLRKSCSFDLSSLHMTPLDLIRSRPELKGELIEGLERIQQDFRPTRTQCRTVATVLALKNKIKIQLSLLPNELVSEVLVCAVGIDIYGKSKRIRDMLELLRNLK